jgi:hypothetical protein
MCLGILKSGQSIQYGYKIVVKDVDGSYRTPYFNAKLCHYIWKVVDAIYPLCSSTDYKEYYSGFHLIKKLNAILVY